VYIYIYIYIVIYSLCDSVSLDVWPCLILNEYTRTKAWPREKEETMVTPAVILPYIVAGIQVVCLALAVAMMITGSLLVQFPSAIAALF
jgi:hypothetical protein